MPSYSTKLAQFINAARPKAVQIEDAEIAEIAARKGLVIEDGWLTSFGPEYNDGVGDFWKARNWNSIKLPVSYWWHVEENLEGIPLLIKPQWENPTHLRAGNTRASQYDYGRPDAPDPLVVIAREISLPAPIQIHLPEPLCLMPLTGFEVIDGECSYGGIGSTLCFRSERWELWEAAKRRIEAELDA